MGYVRYTERISSFLFRNLFSIYKPAYFFYKRYSDNDRIKILKQNISKGDVVLDIGANVGFYSLLFSDLVGNNGKVYAFEPDKLNFNYLQRLIKQKQNISSYNLAVGEQNKVAKLFISDDLNVDHHTYDIGEERKAVDIKMVAIDEFLETDLTVDIIKIDIQGYDFFAMKGMKSLLARNKKLTIFGEFWPYALHKAGVDPNEYLDYLKELGFDIEVIGLENDNYDQYIDNRDFYTDFLAIKEN